jgi:hypothetical protein
MPWRLTWKKEVEARSVAMGLERKIKSRGAGRFLADSGIIMH